MVRIIIILLNVLLFLSMNVYSLPRGVLPYKEEIYTPENGIFKCRDGTGNYDMNVINDDYCDCLDGSDEPGTNACNNGYFYCNNDGHRPKIIPSSHINDGICDCCDGSDEYGSNDGNCQNTCDEEGKM